MSAPELADKGGAVGAFFHRRVAVVVATPCTAPFMGAALGYGLYRAGLESVSIFLMLGLGLAAPFTALAFAPGLARKLPKPGPWMVSFKEFLAFPMIAAAVWLMWVLAQQAGAKWGPVRLIVNGRPWIAGLGYAYAERQTARIVGKSAADWSWRLPCTD